ncbi:hypothetical protein [Pandoraea pnomenusa]|uniref:hypothetical protein n=1 Tax=Pandoraea pnomenusa TaxID=93220 RepID=UPI00333EBF97
MKKEDRKSSESVPRPEAEAPVTELNAQEIDQVSGGAGGRKTTTVLAGNTSQDSPVTANKKSFF